MVSCSRFEHKYTKSFFKYTEPFSADYKVFINGEEAAVYTCRISKHPFNRIWPGYQRSAAQTRMASYVNIVSDEAVEIRVVPTHPQKDVILKPYSKGIVPLCHGGEITFTLKENGQYLLQNDDGENCLYIFNSKPIFCERSEDVTHYFGPGIHMPGKIKLSDNESVYVDKDALVFGCIFAENAENIRIFGNGVLDDRAEGRIDNSCYEEFTNGNIKLYDCKNIHVEGVSFIDSAIWCVNVFHCNNAVFDNIKVFGQWRYNTDGIDIVNSQNITVKNSFIHSFDDTITIKGIDRYAHTNNENMLIENCVLWCDWGNCCEIGIETACREYKNIVFRNCDVLNSAHVALDVNNGFCAEVSNIVFENIRVEYNSFTRPNVYQETEEMTYEPIDKIHIPQLFRLQNLRFRTREEMEKWGAPEEYMNFKIDLEGIREACIHDIKINDITVYYDEKIPKFCSKFNIPAQMTSLVDGVEFYNIEISDIKVNGQKVSLDYLNLDVNDAVKYYEK